MKSNAKIVIEKLKKRLSQKMEELPPVLMNEGQKEFTKNFTEQSWEGQKWKPRAKGNKNTRPILIGRTRKLINSVRTSGRVSSIHKIVWASYVPYAKAHNEGFKAKVNVKAYRRKPSKSKLAKLGAKHQVKSHTRIMNLPKRQFMGVGNSLRARLIRKTEQFFKL